MASLNGAQGQYRIDPNLRREGGQAEVLRATGPDGVAVAIKMPRAGRGHGWFTREAGLLRQLTRRDRPWVVPLLDEGIAGDGRPFIVLPWFEEALDEWLERGQAIDRILEALTLACESVVRLHRAPVDLANVLVHRDVKPYNFLVRDDGTELVVVLADLGIAKEGRLAVASTQTGIFTECYAPPEQQLPLALPPDPSMDVHGLAATVWFALCGRVPRAIFSRQAAWKEEAADLRALAVLGTKRNREEGAKFEALRRLPIESYADLGLMAALRPQDEQELVQRLEGALATRVDEPIALARTLSEKLLPILRRSLEPDHRKRLGEAQRLYAAVRHARDMVVAAVGARRPVPGSAAIAPVIVGPAGGTIVPSVSVETFDQGKEISLAGPVSTGSLPTLELDEGATGPSVVAPPRHAPALRAQRAPQATLDPTRTMDPLAEPPERSRAGWFLAAMGVAFAGVVAISGAGWIGWRVWLAAEVARPVTSSPAPEPAVITPPPSVVEAPPALAQEQPPGLAPEKAMVEKKEAHSKVPEVVAPVPVVVEVAPVVGPVTIRVKRCDGEMKPGDLTADDKSAALDVAQLVAGHHTLQVKGVDSNGPTGKLHVISVVVERDRLRVKGTERLLGEERSETVFLDVNGRTHFSEDRCP